jgi:CheY-like chemotaxis protein
MDEKTMKRIFDPFFTTKEMGRGTGLGLAAVYGIITGHQGSIYVYSEKGHGTTFSIYLPASEKEARADEKIARGAIRGEGVVLLVDDEPSILGVTKEIIELLGYTVLGADSGMRALDLYRENWQRIDLVILDMIMPGMGGGEIFDRLREINPAVKVILSSGYSLNGEASTIMVRGCRGFLQKPANIEELSSLMHQVLSET